MLDDFIQYEDGTSRPKTKEDYLKDELWKERHGYVYNGKWYPDSDERSHPM